MRSTRIAIVIAAAMSAAACGKDTPPPAPPPPQAKPPLRGAVGDTDLRVMVAELASAKACTMMKGQFRALRAPDEPGTATGILWIRDCRIRNSGTKVTFELAGNGWQWAQQEKKKAGATFALAQEVRFAVDITIPGTLDVAYDRSSHVVSVWFSPSRLPEVRFTPIGDFDVDEQGAWASTLGAVSSLFGSAPEEQAANDARGQGTQAFEKQLADGLAVTIDLCTGLSRFNLGRPRKGEMQPPDVGETHRVPFELHPSGMMVLGPYFARKGMTAQLDVDADGGSVRAAVMCHDDAERLAAAYVEGRELPDVRSLAIQDITGKGTLAVKSATCPVAVVAREIPTAGNAPVRFTWQRPTGESARSTGGPLIHCAREQTARRP